MAARNEAGPVKLALLQRRAHPDPQRNIEETLAAAREAAEQGARIICTQELFATPYFCQRVDPALLELAEPIPGPTTRRFQALAREREVVVVVSLFERRAPGLFHNTAVVIDADGSLLGLYRKMHIPEDPQFHEKFYFAPGDTGFRSWRTRHGRLGVLICWDQWFPEAARLTAMAGAELLLYPTAIGWLPSEKAAEGARQREAWELIQRSHAIANGCFVAAVNRVGFEEAPGTEGIEFWGGSFVAGPLGEVLARAPEDREETLLVELDWRRIEECRRWWPFWRDRRVDAYGGLTRRWAEDPAGGSDAR
ncbi:MAG: acyltransferase [Verrucomicrobia bacterium]|nr:MAG: acyltransferase [Verrucomicrobiota bacterium]